MLKIGMSGQAVKNLQTNLTVLGYVLTADGKFGPVTANMVKKYQVDKGLTVDGIAGPQTQTSIAKALIAKYTQPKPPVVVPSEGIDDLSYVKWFEDRLGWNEFDKDKELSEGWKYTNVPYYKTVIGLKYAWCAMSLCTALEENGFKSTRDAGADSFSFLGQKCGYVAGAILPIRHKNGSRHVNIFLYWVDEKKKLAMCIGGNQDNAITKAVYNLSGNAAGHDEVINGPRRPEKKAA